MPRIVREADVTWEGSLARGAGAISAGTSGAFTRLPYSLPSRIGAAEGRTSPEELLASAHGGCFTMSVAGELGKLELPFERVDVRCRITMDEVGERGHLIVGSALTVRVTGDVPHDLLEQAVDAAHAGCPFSTLLVDAGAEVEIAIEPAG